MNARGWLIDITPFALKPSISNTNGWFYCQCGDDYKSDGYNCTAEHDLMGSDGYKENGTVEDFGVPLVFVHEFIHSFSFQISMNALTQFMIVIWMVIVTIR